MATKSVGEFQAFLSDIVKCQETNEVDAVTALSEMLAEHMNIHIEGMETQEQEPDKVNWTGVLPDRIHMFRD